MGIELFNNPAVRFEGGLVPRVGAATVITAALSALVNIPSASAMDDTGLRVCMNSCHQRYRGDDLERCIQRCWAAFTSPWGDL